MPAAGRRLLRATLTAVLVAGCTSGCRTGSLWQWASELSDPDAVPELTRSRTVCTVDAVRTPDGAAPTAGTSWALAFTPHAADAAPRHLAARSRSGPIWLRVRTDGELPVANAMAGFEPESFEVDVFDGEHLRRRTNNVRLTLYGTVSRDAVGALSPASAVDPALRAAPPLDDDVVPPWGPARAALRALDALPWSELLTPSGRTPISGTPVPIAFVDAAGVPIPPAVVHGALTAAPDDPWTARMAESSLVARVRDGSSEWYVRLRVPVLLNADRLGLQPFGDGLAFAWAQRGRGRFVDANALPRGLRALDLPLQDRSLVYEWTTEQPVVEPWIGPLQFLLAPLGFVFDVLVETNPALRALRDWLFPPPPPPMRPRGSR